MATTQKYDFAGFEVIETLTDDWQRAWIASLRVLLGWWFLHAGLTKILTDGFNFAYGPIYLTNNMKGTVLGPLAVWMGNNLAWLIKPGVPLFETLIGLGLMLGVFTRLAAVGGTFFMTMFFVGNADFAHGMVNTDLMGLLLFLTMIVFAAGRYWGLDAIVEQTSFVKDHPRLRYLLG